MGDFPSSRARLPRPLWAVLYRKRFCVWSMFTDAEILLQLCPLFIHAQSICFMTHESQQVCSSANRPICRLGGRALCGKPALTTVHPHTDPWKALAALLRRRGQLASGHLPSEQMGPSPGSSRTRMCALAASVFLICLYFTGDKFLLRKAKFTE